MKSLILASAMAAAAVLSTALPSQAANVTVVTDAPPPPRHHMRDHRPHQTCMVKKVKSYRHGAVVWKETRVCR